MSIDPADPVDTAVQDDPHSADNLMLDINLRGRDYRVSCAPGERETLLAAVAFLDNRMRDIGERTGSSGERLAVMTALNLAHELLGLTSAAPAFDTADFARRIRAIEARLDEAMAPQENLF